MRPCTSRTWKNVTESLIATLPHHTIIAYYRSASAHRADARGRGWINGFVWWWWGFFKLSRTNQFYVILWEYKSSRAWGKGTHKWNTGYLLPVISRWAAAWPKYHLHSLSPPPRRTLLIKLFLHPLHCYCVNTTLLLSLSHLLLLEPYWKTWRASGCHPWDWAPWRIARALLYVTLYLSLSLFMHILYIICDDTSLPPSVQRAYYDDVFLFAYYIAQHLKSEDSSGWLHSSNFIL